jgi:hypothetical protein
MVKCVATIVYVRIHSPREKEERHGIAKPVQAVNLSRSEPVCAFAVKTNLLSNVPTGQTICIVFTKLRFIRSKRIRAT